MRVIFLIYLTMEYGRAGYTGARLYNVAVRELRGL